MLVRFRLTVVLLSSLALLSMGGNAFAAPPGPASVARPNIVLIVLDDMGYGDPGAFGGTFVQTPELDDLAAEGMIFTQHYANAPVCSPSRAALLTGHYPQEYGVRRAIPPNSYRGLPADPVSLPEMLRSEGYVTGHFGKWHLGQQRPEYLPNAQGYDTSAAQVIIPPQSYWDPTFLIDDANPVQIEGHVTRITTDFALNFIQSNAASRFFASISYFAPHAPLEPTPEWAAQYSDNNRGRYAALISDADEQIGEIVDAIDALGLAEETIILVTSDNGSEQGGIDSNGIHRGSKADLYEGGIRTPLFVRWPDTVTAGAVNGSPILLFDLLPTLAAHLGVDTSAMGLEGQDMRAAILQDQAVARPGQLFWETKDDTSFFVPLFGELNRFAVRDGDWKLVQQDNATSLGPELYDITNDPTESVNLAAANPTVVQQLTADYRAWRAGIGVIPYEVAKKVGQVRGNWSIGRGGRIELARDVRFDFNDGDFSLQARIKSGAGSENVVAELPGSWRLSLLENLRLQLVVHGPNTSTTLITQVPPTPNVDVAFTVFGWRFSPSTVSLYVNGALVGQSNEIDEVSPSTDTIYVGNSREMDAQYRGRIKRFRLHSQALTAAEIQAGL